MSFSDIWRIKQDESFKWVYIGVMCEFGLATIVIFIGYLRRKKRIRTWQNQKACNPWFFVFLSAATLIRGSIYLDAFFYIPIQLIALMIFLPSYLLITASLFLIYYKYLLLSLCWPILIRYSQDYDDRVVILRKYRNYLMLYSCFLALVHIAVYTTAWFVNLPYPEYFLSRIMRIFTGGSALVLLITTGVISPFIIRKMKLIFSESPTKIISWMPFISLVFVYRVVIMVLFMIDSVQKELTSNTIWPIFVIVDSNLAEIIPSLVILVATLNFSKITYNDSVLYAHSYMSALVDSTAEVRERGHIRMANDIPLLF